MKTKMIRRALLVAPAVLLAATVTAVVGPGAQHAAHASTGGIGGDYIALATEGHLLDTRSAVGVSTKTPIGAQGTVTFPVLGHGGVPTSGVTGVLVDITVVSPTANTYLAIGPDDASFTTPSPSTSNVGVSAGSSPLSNSAVVAIPADGKLKVYNGGGTAHAVVDVQGYYTSTTVSGGPGGLVPTAHTRVLDTRSGFGQSKATSIASGGSLTVNLGYGGVIPAGAGSAYLDAIVVGADAGWLGAYPVGGNAAAATSDFDFLAGTTASGITTKLGTNNGVVFVNHSAAKIDLILTAEGYTSSDSSAGAAYRPARFRVGPVSVAANATTDFQVVGQGGVPTHGVAAIAGSVGAVGGTAGGHLVAYPADGPAPATSLANFPASTTRADLAILQPSADGKIRVLNSSATATTIYIDVLAWYSDGKSNAVDTVPNTPMSLVQANVSGPIEGVYIRNSGTPFHGVIPSNNLNGASWAAINNDQEAFTGQPAVVALGNNLLVSMLHANDGEVWQFTVPATTSNSSTVPTWNPTFVKTGGIMASAPVSGVFNDGATAMTFAVDANGLLWARSSAAGSYWRPVGSNAQLVGTPSVALNRSANALNIVARNTAGNIVTASYSSAGVMSGWTNLGGTGTTRPAALELTGPRLRIAALQADGTVVTVLQNLNGSFPAWKTVAGPGHQFVGAPALTLDQDRASSTDPGTDECVILMRESQDGEIYESDETAEASDQFGPWLQPTRAAASTDPSAIQVGGVASYHWVGAYIDVNATPTPITTLNTH